MKPTEIIASRLARQDRPGETLAPIHTLREFLQRHARVKQGAAYVPYHFEGREALAQIVDRIDEIIGGGQRDVASSYTDARTERSLGSHPLPSQGEGRGEGASRALPTPTMNSETSPTSSGLPLNDSSLAICGGAQFGKTVLMLNLLVYLAAVRFRNVGYYLPDDDLVQGIVDGKLRPDVLDQIPEIAQLIQLGKTLNATGRAVNRKGALLVTDGQRTALAYLRGMGKVPTTFSMDVVIQDEKDDIAEYNAKFLAGRMTASDLRFSLSIGTQRYHGAGQNREFEDGTQHVGVLFPQNAGDRRPEAGDRKKSEESPSSALPQIESIKDPHDGGACTRMQQPVTQSEKGSSIPAIALLDATSRCHPLPSQGEGRGEGASRTFSSATMNSETSPTSSRLQPPASCLPLRGINPEEHWPQVCRLSRDEILRPDDPQLTHEGDFASVATGQHFPVSAMHQPGARVYLADPVTGAPLDRRNVKFIARHPEREVQRKWSYRISQLIIDAIDLKQIVAAWEQAVRDPDRMTAFCTDRLALPRSTTQALDPAILQRARDTAPYTLTLTEPHPAPPHSEIIRYAGLDMGDRCWFVARQQRGVAPSNVDVESDNISALRNVGAGAIVPAASRTFSSATLNGETSPTSSDFRPPVSGLPSAQLCWAEMISAERIRERVPELCRALGVRVLFVDAGPLRDLSRDLCFLLDGGGRRWDETAGVWRYEHGAAGGCRAAAVEFTLKEGQGVKQKPGLTQDGKLYPLIACNREETIARVIDELTAPNDPRFLLPQRTAQLPPILATYEQHLLSGSRQERGSDGKSMHFVDKCENHFLLATAYAALAQRLDLLEHGHTPVLPVFTPMPRARRARCVEG